MNETITGFLRATATPEKQSMLNRAFTYITDKTDQDDELEMALNMVIQQADISLDSLDILNNIVTATSQAILNTLVEFGLSFDTNTPLDILMDVAESLVVVEGLVDEQFMYINTEPNPEAGVDDIVLFTDLISDYSVKPSDSVKTKLFPYVMEVKDIFFKRIKTKQEAVQINTNTPTSVTLDNRKLTFDNLRKFFEFANTKLNQTKTLGMQLLQSGLDINFSYEFYLSSIDPEELIQTFKASPETLAVHLYSLVIMTDDGRTNPMVAYTGLVNKIGITSDADAIVTNYVRELNGRFDAYKKQT